VILTVCQLYISNYSIHHSAFVCYPNVLATQAPFVIILIHTHWTSQSTSHPFAQKS
jgi:hypothetical protein